MSRRKRGNRDLSQFGAGRHWIRRRQTTALGSLPFHRRLRFEPLEDRRLLANVTVGNLNDVVDGNTASIAALIGTPGVDGSISLREAILAANADNTDPADTINFGSTVTGVIQLTNVLHVGEIVINNNLTINGPGANVLTIRAFAGTAAVGDGARIFNVSDGNLAAVKTVAMSGLTLTGGDGGSAPGGAIRSYVEDLTLTACTITGNQISGLGGAVWQVNRNLTVNACTISGNTALNGGGIYAFNATVNVTDSTISGNTSTTTPNNQGGGGISKYGGSLTVANSTISGNRTNNRGGGIYNFSGSLLVRHSTITGNTADLDNNGAGSGGGVYSRNVVATATFNHAIVAGNLRQASISNDLSGPVVASSAFNLIGVNTGLTGISNGTNGNQIGTAAAPLNPVLGPLANNGGPTRTHAFLAGSPAIDAGDPLASAGVGNVPLNDQRGATFGRVVDGDGAGGARIDLGAYEQQSTQAANLLVVDTLVDENDGNHSPGDFSLREALDLANASAGPNTIAFTPALTSGGPATILLTLGQLTIARAMTINGPGAHLLTVDATGNDPTPTMNNGDGSRVFNINNDNSLIDVSIDGLTLTGGDSALSGGAITNSENLTISDSTISGNHTSIHGGGIVGLSNITIIRTTITGNSAGIRGGGLYSGLSSVHVQDSTISANSAAEQGGGILISSGNLMLTDSTVNDNTATGSGGGVRIANLGNWSATVARSTLVGNSTNVNGGGLAVNAVGVTGSLTVTDSTISGNTAAMRGGGVSTVAATTTIVSSTISGNTATVSGGGVFNQDATATIRHSTITANTAPAGEGSGIASQGNGATHTVLHSSIVARNTNSDVDSIVDPDNSFESDGFNLIGTSDSLGAFNQPGDQTGVSNPMLGPLANNGGPTFTHALLAGSPAIDVGDPAAVAGVGNVPLQDQRGAPFVRVFDGDGAGGARIDIGAYEQQSIVVDTLTDMDDGDYSAGDLSLREALGLTNGSLTLNTIAFAASLTSSGPAAILLTNGELSITDSLTINGPGASLLTIDASGNDPTPTLNNGDGSRVFNVNNGDAGFSNVSIRSLGLTGGDSSASPGGGAIYNEEFLAVTDCIIFGNSVSGSASVRGGGINNAGHLTISDSTISNNTTNRGGGGIFSSLVLIVVDSTISGNSASFGGGVNVFASAALISGSTISGNSALIGGGLYCTAADTLTLTNCTISDNLATSRGGAIFNEHGEVVLRHSTITNNTAFSGGGVSSRGTTSPFVTRTLLHSTIVAGNINSDVNFVDGPDNTFDSDGSNLIGTGNALAAFSQPGDQTGVTNPMLGPLADNGGPTFTHALLAGSPAIDAGDPAAVAGVGTVPLHDQRGAPFVRIVDGNAVPGARIDIGAFELQPVGPALPGDYNLNGVVDAADYVVWRNTLGNSVTPFGGADGDGDGTVDQDDYGVWRAHFGQTLPAAGAGSSASVAGEVGSAEGASGISTVSVTETLAAAQAQAEPPAEPRAVDVFATFGRKAGLAPSRSRQDAAAMWRSVSTRQDDVLLAWLSSQASTESDRGNREPKRSIEDEHLRNADDWQWESVDLLFQLVGSDD